MKIVCKIEGMKTVGGNISPQDAQELLTLIKRQQDQIRALSSHIQEPPLPKARTLCGMSFIIGSGVTLALVAGLFRFIPT